MKEPWTESHLDAEQMARLLAADGPCEEIQKLSLHLAVCRPCRRRLVESYPAEGSAYVRSKFPNLIHSASSGFARAWEEAWAAAGLAVAGPERAWLGPERPGEIWMRNHPDVVAEVSRKALQLSREQREARELWAEIAPLVSAQRQLKVLNSERFKTLGVVGVLLEHARQAWTSEPEEAEALAQLALEVLAGLDRRDYEGMVLEDYRARGLAYLGNARRVRSDLAGADEALEAAQAALELGTWDVMERAVVLRALASLRRDQRRFDEAMDFAAEAAELYRSIGDRQQEAWMWVAQALIAGEVGRTEEAIGLLEGVLRRYARIDIGDRIYFGALQGLGHRLVEAGRAEEARRYLPEIRRLAKIVAEPLLTVRVSWLEGLIHDAEGEVEAAARCYRVVRDTFIAQGIGYDAALVSLDLALLYLRQGCGSQARELAAEMLPIFRSRGIHREALGALRIFHEALAQETATAVLAREVADYLKRARRAPDLPFEPAAG